MSPIQTDQNHAKRVHGVCIVTGGGRGIGAATARLAGRRGYPVAIFFREREATAQAVVSEIVAAGGSALAIRADVSDEAALTRGFAAADALGPLELLVNNAAIVGNIGRLETATGAMLDTLVRTNIVGAFLAAREAARRMSTRHGGQGGSIVNVSSGAAQLGSPGVWVHYAATKGAIDTMTIGLAKELGAEGIRVNAVRPGIIVTEIHDPRPPGQLEKMTQMVPLQRVGTAEEVANAILWLASDEAAYVTAALVDVRGGL